MKKQLLAALLVVIACAKIVCAQTSQKLQWQPLGEPGSGGWITAFQISPHDSRRALTGGDMLGVGLTTDGGQSWQSTFGFSSWEINDFTWHPKNPNIVWAGTLMGPYLSTDGGKNWTSKRKGFPAQAHFGFSATVERVLFDPNDDKHLIAFGGSSRGWDLPGPRSLYGAVWESKDAGESWTKIATIGKDGNTEDVAQGVNIYAMTFAAGSSTQLYAGAARSGFYVSKDGGKTWTKSTSGLPFSDARRVIAHPMQRDTVFIALANGKGADGKFIPGGIYKSTDAGATWNSISNGLAQKSDANSNFTSRYEALAVSPSNPDVMYTADTAWNTGVIYVTRDGGKNWRAAATKGNVGLPSHEAMNKVAVIQTAYPSGATGTYAAVDPKNPDVAWILGGEHLLATRDGGKTWSDEGNIKTPAGWRGRGFSGLCSMNVAFDPFVKNRVLVQAMDAARAWVSTDGGNTWNYNQGIEKPWPWGGGKAASFAKDGTIYITTGQHGGFFGVGISRDGGQSWKSVFGPRHGLPEKEWGKENKEPGGVYTLPDDSSKVWAVVGGKLYTSANVGESWNVVPDVTGANWIAGDPQTPQRFYVSTGKSTLATEDGKTFVSIAGPTKAGRITIDSQSRVLVASHEGERGGLWRYDPKDKSWTRLFDEARVMNVAVDARNSNRLAVITNQDPYTELNKASGVWVSSDGGASWSHQNDGLAMLRGHAIAFDPHNPSTLIVGTFGRGFFKTQWPTSLAFNSTRRYVSTAEDTRFASATPQPQVTANAQVTPTGLLKNGAMTDGDATPTNWSEKWGDVKIARDTEVFKSAPASFRVEVAGGKSGSGFQMIESPGSKVVTVSGWVKTQGEANVNVALQSFDKDWKQNKFEQLKFLQGNFDWQQFSKKVTVPDWAARFNIQLNLQGSGKAWLDDVQLVRDGETAPATAPSTPVASSTPTTGAAATADITYVIRDFGGTDYTYGADWKNGQNVKSSDGALRIDATENGGGGVVLNGTNIVPQGQTHLAMRAKLLPGNGAKKLNVNLKGPEKSVSFDLTKLNEQEYSVITVPLGDGKFDNVQQMQLQGTNWSPAAAPLKILIDKIGTTSNDASANATALASAKSDPKNSAPAKDKPSVAGWGFFPDYPQAWMNLHNGYVNRAKENKTKPINVVFFGDSITQGWGGEGKTVWAEKYAPLGAVNFGIGGDSTRQVLWRIQNGEVEGLNPKLVVLKIGTNNLYDNFNSGSNEEIAEGIKTIVTTLRTKLPNTKVLLLGLLPRQNDWFTKRTMHINSIISKLDDGKNVRFLDMTPQFQTEVGKVKPELYIKDQLHLAAPGYQVWAETMQPLFDELMK